MRSVSSATRPSQAATLASSTSRGGGSGCGQISASHSARMRSSPAAGIMRVTKTFGLAAIGKSSGGSWAAAIVAADTSTALFRMTSDVRPMNCFDVNCLPVSLRIG